MSIEVYVPDDTRLIHVTKVDFGRDFKTGNGWRSNNFSDPVFLVQYDRSLPILAVRLMFNGYSYTLPANSDLTIRLGKKDGTFVIKHALGCNEQRNIAYFEIDGQMTYYPGPVSPIIELKIGESVAGSSIINFEIARNPVQEGMIESTNEYIDLVQAVSDAQSSAKLSESYAVGGTGTRAGEDTDNAKYYKETVEHALDDYYNKSETNSLLSQKVDKTTTVNGHALSQNVTVTKSDVGLSNVNNTSDLDKPISTATQSALDVITTSSPMQSGINASKVSSYDSHIQNGDIHVTVENKNTWNAKQDALPSVTKDRFLHTNASSGALEWSQVVFPEIINDTNHTDIDKSLSANMGKELQDEINNLKSLGRFLSNWNCMTGLPQTNPTTMPYVYHSGDYFLVSVVAAIGETNYQPDGSSYTGVASSAIEWDSDIAIGDAYFWDGNTWVLLKNHARIVIVDETLDNESTNPVENRVVTNALSGKQQTIDSSHKLSSDLVDDTDKTNKFVTTSEKSTWNSKQDALVSGTNIKTINGTDVLGSGNLVVTTYQPFPNDWSSYLNGTTSAFCSAVNSTSSAVKGMAYLGEVTFSDFPTGLINAEIVVEVMEGTGTSNKVIHLILTSGNLAPYRWEYTYWNNGSSVSGWIGFQPEITSTNKLGATKVVVDASYDSGYEGSDVSSAIYGLSNRIDNKQDALVSGTNIKTINSTTLLGSGNISVQSVIDSSHKLSSDLVDDTNNTNKFVTASEKTTWNGKQDQIKPSNPILSNSVVFSSLSPYEGMDLDQTVESLNQQIGTKQATIDSSHKLLSDLVDDTNCTNKFVTASDKSSWSSKQNAIDSSHKLSSDLVDDTNNTNKFVTASDKSNWNNKLSNASEIIEVGELDQSLPSNNLRAGGLFLRRV